MSSGGLFGRLRGLFDYNYDRPPWFFKARSHTLFIIFTVGIGLFSDLFLYGLVVPMLPFFLVDRVHLPESEVQAHTSVLLAAYAIAAVLISPIAGVISDKTSSRQMPFLAGLSTLIFATAMLFSAYSVAVLAIARVLQGASSAFVWTVGLAMCVDTVGPEKLGTVVGSIFSIVSVGAIVAPLAGGTLYEKFGAGAVAALALGILAVDFIMRLLVIEKKIAERYLERNPSLAAQADGGDGSDQSRGEADDAQEASEDQATESDPLLPPGTSNGSQASKTESDYFLMPDDQPAWIKRAPILYCLSAPSLTLALVVALVQATVIGSFDATVVTHAKTLYSFNSLTASLFFIPLGLCDVIIGPIAGWVTDNYGTKLTGVVGYAYLVPVLSLLRIPEADPFPQQAILYGGVLALCGVGLATIGPPSIVEAGAVVDKFYKRNPDKFGKNGPYAQLYGLNSMVFNLGLSVGPVMAGTLKDAIGYGNMNAVLAGVCGLTAIGCYIWLGGKPKPFMGRPHFHSS